MQDQHIVYGNEGRLYIEPSWEGRGRESRQRGRVV